jgi:hypothetical protein
MYLDDINDDENPGVIHVDEDHNMPSAADYRDMHVDEGPEDDNEEAIDKYLNVELTMNKGINDEWWGCVIKRTRGLDGEPIGRAHTNPPFWYPWVWNRIYRWNTW